MLRVAQNTAEPISATNSAPNVSRPESEPFRPNQLIAIEYVIIAPHVNTSPWAKLISSRMP